MRIETVSYTIEWRKFLKGQSFFVPCIDIRAARQTLKTVTKRLNKGVAKRLKIELVTKVVIEEGVKGLRVWRV